MLRALNLTTTESAALRPVKEEHSLWIRGAPRLLSRDPTYSVQLGINVTPEMRATMQELSARTRIPQSVLFREALENLFAKYAETLRAPKGEKVRK